MNYIWSILFCVLRIGDLGCGYQGSGLICCPQISDPNTIAPNSVVDGQRCGASQVQGDGYDSIGAFPWVVRIGFRSKNSFSESLCAKCIIHIGISKHDLIMDDAYVSEI